MFIVLLTNIVNASNAVSLSNQKCEIQPTLINLHFNKYCQVFYYYPYAVKLDRCVGSCNKVCILKKIEDSNLSEFNMLTEINESKTFTKHT